MAPVPCATDEVLRLVRDPAGPPLVLLTGRPGSGLTAVLAAVAEALRADGRPVQRVHVETDGVPVQDEPAIAADLPLPSTAGAADDEAIARRACQPPAAAYLSGSADTVLLVDDAGWMGRDARAVVAALVRRLAGSAVRHVCAVALPDPGGAESAATLERLRADGLVAAVRVAPLDRGQIAGVVGGVVGAAPSPDTCELVRTLSRGLLSPVRHAARTLADSGALRTVDGHAYLVPDARHLTRRVRAPHLLAAVEHLGPDARRAAGCAAVLAPLGPALPAVLARVLEIPVDEARERLERLRAGGVLHRDRRGGWRFPLPLAQDALVTAMAPYERRRVSAAGVTAVWAGEAEADGAELADLVAAAGRLLPAERAWPVIAEAAGTTAVAAPRRVARWWRVAADLATDPRARVRALEQHAFTCFLAGDTAEALAGLKEVLADLDVHSSGAAEELATLLVVGLHQSRDLEGLDALATGVAPWSRDDPGGTLARALALAYSDRWRQAHGLLVRTRGVWTSSPYTHSLGELIEHLSALLGGEIADFDAVALATAPADIPQSPMAWRHRVDIAVACRIALGDGGGVGALVEALGLAWDDLHPAHRAVVALLEDGEDAVDTARQALAAGSARLEVGPALLYQALAVVMICGGRLGAARALVAVGRAEAPVLGHLLESADAVAEMVLGERGAAAARLEKALAGAAENGVVVGTDLLHVTSLQIAWAEGDAAAVRAHARELDRVAAVLRSPRTGIYAEFGHALAERDRGSAARCLERAREAGRYEVVHLAPFLVEAGLLDPAVLLEVYELTGRLGALLGRALCRTAMAAHGIPVPGRAVTKTENERLLGRLLTDGLTNRQIATLLGSSEKSVEGRLGRLLARTGYRSRIELATALAGGLEL